MLHSVLRLRNAALAIAVVVVFAPLDVVSVELRPGTAAAFDRYVQATQARVDGELKRPGAFLYFEGMPGSRRKEIEESLRQGGIYIERLSTLDAEGRRIKIPDGLAHHWIGGVFVKGATVGDAIALAEDYDHHQDYYRPEVVRSQLIRRDGNDFKIYYRLRKHKVITVTLNTVHDVQYFRVDDLHWHSRSVSLRIAEVENAGKPDEREKPVGDDGGFLWRLDSWWRYEEKDGGVYIESEAVSLTRDIPAGLGWLIGPFITSIPRESLQMTLENTRSAIQGRAAARRKVKN
jgi:hypothetical protein